MSLKDDIADINRFFGKLGLDEEHYAWDAIEGIERAAEAMEAALVGVVGLDAQPGCESHRTIRASCRRILPRHRIHATRGRPAARSFALG